MSSVSNYPYWCVICSGNPVSGQGYYCKPCVLKNQFAAIRTPLMALPIITPVVAAGGTNIQPVNWCAFCGKNAVSSYGGLCSYACISSFWNGTPVAPAKVPIDLSRFPHKCKCGAPAYKGFNSIECSSSACTNYKA